jgi:hypothetical protein
MGVLDILQYNFNIYWESHMQILHFGRYNWFRPHYAIKDCFKNILYAGIVVQEGPSLEVNLGCLHTIMTFYGCHNDKKIYICKIK